MHQVCSLIVGKYKHAYTRCAVHVHSIQGTNACQSKPHSVCQHWQKVGMWQCYSITSRKIA